MSFFGIEKLGVWNKKLIVYFEDTMVIIKTNNVTLLTVSDRIASKQKNTKINQ